MGFELEFQIESYPLIVVAAVVGIILIFYFLCKVLLKSINSKVELLVPINMDLDLTCEDCNAEDCNAEDCNAEETEETEETDIKESDNETK